MVRLLEGWMVLGGDREMVRWVENRPPPPLTSSLHSANPPKLSHVAVSGMGCM